MKKISSLSSVFSLLLLLIGLVGTLIFSKEIAVGIGHGIDISLQNLIPSLFFFMVLSSMVGRMDLKRFLPFPKAAEKLFRFDRSILPIFLLSLIGGYPVGAKLIGDKVKSGALTPQQGEKLLPFCVNCSPAFLLSGISIPLWQSVTPGILLYFSQLLAAVILAVFSNGRETLSQKEIAGSSAPFSVILVDSVKSGARSMGVICIFVVFFSALFPIFDLIPLPEKIKLLFIGLSEVTYGCQLLSGDEFFAGLFLTSLFTSFGGICVHLQIAALLSGSKIPLKSFFLSRILYTGLSVSFTVIGSFFLDKSDFTQQVTDCFTSIGNQEFFLYSSSPLASILLLFLVIILLLSRGKSVIINPKELHQERRYPL